MAETPNDPKINSGGGAVINAPLTIGGDFIGRDQINIIIQPPEEKITGKPSIPHAPGHFVGREAELDALCQSMAQDAINRTGVIISGLHGLGGIGKTALALKAAERLQPNYPDGGIFLDLHGLDAKALTPKQALEYVIHAFVRPVKLPDSLAELQLTFSQVLGGKHLLLLLDNARDKEQVAPLLDALPAGCMALVTSRIHFYYPGMQDQQLNVLSEAEAIQLLHAIAPRVGHWAAELARVCGYLPLALQVIGSLLHEKINLSPQDVLAFVQDAVTRLEMTTVDASLELSYQMLPEHLREPWRKLAVFAGDFNEMAAAVVWGLISGQTISKDYNPVLLETKKTLGELLTYSLVEYEDERYYLHDLSRLFAGEKLSAEEEYAARLVHAQYYFQLLRVCNNLYKQGNEKILAGLAWFDREQREISAGWAWAAGSLQGDTGTDRPIDTARLRLCCYYPRTGAYVLDLRQDPRELIRWVEPALLAARRLNDQRAESGHLCSLGTAFDQLGELQQAIVYYQQALVIERATGDKAGEGALLVNLGATYNHLGETQQAIAYDEQALAIIREISDRRMEILALNNLANAYNRLDQAHQVMGYYEQALAVAREIGDRLGEGIALGNLAGVYYRQGEVQRSIDYGEQRLTIARELGDRRGESIILGNLGSAYNRLGEWKRAIEYYQQSLAIRHEMGDRRGQAEISWSLAEIQVQRHDLSSALTLMQKNVDYLRELNHPDAEKHAARLDEIRARMAWERGDWRGLTELLKKWWRGRND